AVEPGGAGRRDQLAQESGGEARPLPVVGHGDGELSGLPRLLAVACAPYDIGAVGRVDLRDEGEPMPLLHDTVEHPGRQLLQERHEAHVARFARQPREGLLHLVAIVGPDLSHTYATTV